MAAPLDASGAIDRPPHDVKGDEVGQQPSVAEICVENDELGTESWRAKLGRHLVAVQQGVDANLTLVRVGLVVATIGSAYAAVRLSGVFGRFDHVDEIPSHFFRQRKKLRVRMVRQSSRDPSVFYVYHTPFLRRALLHDALPTTTAADQARPLLAVRAFGVQVDETAEEWIYTNIVSSHRAMSLKLLRRLHTGVDGDEPIATCTISVRKFPFHKDFGYELVSKGLAECLPESLENYDDGSANSVQPLVKRLQQLEAAQKNAQTMQYGIWKDWAEDKLTDRVVSAGKRVTSRGLQKLVSKVTGSS